MQIHPTTKYEFSVFFKGFFLILNMFIRLKHLEDFILKNQNSKSHRISLQLHWSQTLNEGLGLENTVEIIYKIEGLDLLSYDFHP